MSLYLETYKIKQYLGRDIHPKLQTSYYCSSEKINIMQNPFLGSEISKLWLSLRNVGLSAEDTQIKLGLSLTHFLSMNL